MAGNLDRVTLAAKLAELAQKSGMRRTNLAIALGKDLRGLLRVSEYDTDEKAFLRVIDRFKPTLDRIREEARWVGIVSFNIGGNAYRAIHDRDLTARREWLGDTTEEWFDERRPKPVVNCAKSRRRLKDTVIPAIVTDLLAGAHEAAASKEVHLGTSVDDDNLIHSGDSTEIIPEFVGSLRANSPPPTPPEVLAAVSTAATTHESLKRADASTNDADQQPADNALTAIDIRVPITETEPERSNTPSADDEPSVACSVAARLTSVTPYVRRSEAHDRFDSLIKAGHRVIVIVGDRGNGKSRFALEAARHQAKKSVFLEATTKGTLSRDLAAVLISKGITKLMMNDDQLVGLGGLKR